MEHKVERKLKEARELLNKETELNQDFISDDLKEIGEQTPEVSVTKLKDIYDRTEDIVKLFNMYIDQLEFVLIELDDDLRNGFKK